MKYIHACHATHDGAKRERNIVYWFTFIFHEKPNKINWRIEAWSCKVKLMHIKTNLLLFFLFFYQGMFIISCLTTLQQIYPVIFPFVLSFTTLPFIWLTFFASPNAILFAYNLNKSFFFPFNILWATFVTTANRKFNFFSAVFFQEYMTVRKII